MSKQPTFVAYSVKQRDGKQDFFCPIGAAFAHDKGPGFSIQLDALPIGGRIVLLEPKTDKADGNDVRRAPYA